MKKSKMNSKKGTNMHVFVVVTILALLVFTAGAYGAVSFLANKWEGVCHVDLSSAYRGIVVDKDGSYALYDEEENQISESYHELSEDNREAGQIFIRYTEEKDGNPNVYIR
ncbi:MAG: hypothetical protein EOM40_18190 [Clostridia bacterium]|nr:hypothetical protein [Clostridia bacterium]